jgi:hypothetical protein
VLPLISVKRLTNLVSSYGSSDLTAVGGPLSVTMNMRTGRDTFLLFLFLSVIKNVNNFLRFCGSKYLMRILFLFWRPYSDRLGRTLINPVLVNSSSRDSSVGIATDWGLDDRAVGVRVPVGSRIFSTSSGPVLGPTQLPIQWVPWALSPGVKRPGLEADHSPPTSPELKKTWIYIHCPYAFMAWCLIS